jgi:nucleoside-diphosphate-sugar epimerase
VNDNVLATQRLLEAALRAKVKKVVSASSSSVYGDGVPLPMREDAVLHPFSPYGVTKLAAEHLAELYRQNFGLPTVSLRYFTVYGPRQRPDMGFHKFIEAMLDGRPIGVFGDGEQTRDFTFIADAVEANVVAASGSALGVFNVGGGSRVTVNDVLATLGDIAGGQAHLGRDDARQGRAWLRPEGPARGRAGRPVRLAKGPEKRLTAAARPFSRWHAAPRRAIYED